MLAPEKELCGACRRKRDLWKMALNEHKTLGTRIRQRPQQHGIYYREDGAIDAKTESECKKSDERKARTLTKYAETVTQITPAGLHEKFPDAGANDFLADF